MKTAKRRGRPFKEATPGQRAPLGLLVRAEIKRLIDERAKANGRTQSQEAEALIERCLTYDRILDAIDRMGGCRDAFALRRNPRYTFGA